MSSTNRGKTYRAENDYYVTPQEHVRLFLQRFVADHNIDLYKQKILDPCAGGDDKNDMSYPAILFEQGANYNNITTLDIREDSGSGYQGNFLQPLDTWRLKHGEPMQDRPNIIISNPPFALALEFLKRGLGMVEDGGYVIYLLRLNFLGSKRRKSFFDKIMPKYIYVHHERMSFTDGPTDSIEYAHFVFQKGYIGKSSELFII